MNHNTDQSDFENQLADLLHARVASKEVYPDLDAVVSATVVDPPVRRPATKTWWLAAAALLLIGGIGIRRLTFEPDSAISTEPSAGGDESGDPPISEDTTALLIWLESDAGSTEIEEIAGLLLGSPVVVEIRTLGHDGTLGDFLDHFAELADGVQLIDSESPPAAFKVVTTNPGDVGDLVTDRDGLDGIENTE